MFNQNNFKDLLYDAYGVCSYLSAWEAADLQNILNDELLEFAFDANPENSPVIKEIESLLLYRDEDFPEKHIQKIKLRKMASKSSIRIRRQKSALQNLNGLNPACEYKIPTCPTLL